MCLPDTLQIQVDMLCRDFIKISPGYVARRIYLMRGFMCLMFLQYCVDRSSWTSRLSLLNSFHMSYLKQARDTASGQFTQQNPRSACTYRDHIWHRSLGAFFLLLLLFNKTIYRNPPDLWCRIKYSASSLVVPLTALLLTSRSKIMAKFPVARWKE